MIEIIAATRLAEKDFWSRSALGISLRRLALDTRMVARIAYSNHRGLPEIYNERIAAADAQSLLVFIHDDVWIDDFFFGDRIVEGLHAFDVIGVAGNRRRTRDQPAWAFVDTRFTWDDRANLSGSVAHGKHPFGAVSYFGSVPSECELLDGAFLAAAKSVLAERGVAFDPRFDFHFYDMDFNRSARQRGLRLGTWPICLTHQSSGAFGGWRWQEQYRDYLAKWRD